MAKTTQDLAEAVLSRLGVLALGDTPEAEDAASVISTYADLFQELEEDDIAFWIESDIPERVFRALADFVAGRMATDYGQQRPDLEESGMLRLRKLAQERTAGQPVRADYY